MRAWVGVFMVVVALALPGIAAAADDPVAPEAGPTITVTPNVDLVDHQTVTVAGSGFAPRDFLSLSECPASGAPGSCGFSFDTARTDGAGSFTLVVGLKAVIQTDDGSSLDCRPAPDTCVLAARSWEHDASAATALTFDPSAPLAPPPTLAATPNTDLVDGQVIDVTGSGWRPGAQLFVFACSESGPVDIHCPHVVFGTEDDQADLDGVLATRYRALAVIDVSGGPVDCRHASCFLTAGDPPFDVADQPMVPLEFDPDAPLADPQITVDPTTDLVDREDVAVHGTGWFPHEPVWVAQCLAGEYDETGSCRNAFWEFHTGPDDAFDGTFEVRESFTSFEGHHVDCRVDACAIFASGVDGEVAQVPIAFAAADPTAGDPTTRGPAAPVAVQPQFTG